MQYISKGVVAVVRLTENPEMHEGFLRMTAQKDCECQVGSEILRYVDYTEITKYLENGINQKAIEDLYLELAWLRPSYEEFKACMGPETFAKYKGQHLGAERLLLPSSNLQKIKDLDDDVVKLQAVQENE